MKHVLIQITEYPLRFFPSPFALTCWSSAPQAQYEALARLLHTSLLRISQRRALRPFLPLSIFLLHKEISLKEKKKILLCGLFSKT